MERLNKEIKRRADVVGIFPDTDPIQRLIGAVLLEANDEWQLQHRNMQVEGMAGLAPTLIDKTTPLPPQAACDGVRQILRTGHIDRSRLSAIRPRGYRAPKPFGAFRGIGRPTASRLPRTGSPGPR